MLGHDHEMLIQLFRNRPSLAAALLGHVGGISFPPGVRGRIESSELTDCAPTQYHADAVVRLTAAEMSMAVVVEVQLHRDPGKRWSWPVYLATLRARLNCPTALLVLCPDKATAAWCETPIDMGHPGWVLRPLVAGPDAIPAITDPKRALLVPELAMLSALTHGNDTDVLDTFVTTLHVVDDDQARLYADYVMAALPEAARKYLEALMSAGTYEYQSDFAKKYFTEGLAEGKTEGNAEGKAQSVLAVLEARGFALSQEERERITGCAGPERLDTWVRRAVTVADVDELFR